MTSRSAVPTRNKTVGMFPRDFGQLRELSERLGMVTGPRVSEANVRRAALLPADRAEPDLLLAALKDSAWE